jgi:hypothetical protein
VPCLCMYVCVHVVPGQGQESPDCLRDSSLIALCSHRRSVVGTDDKLVLVAITQWVVIAFYSELMATINADYKTLGAFLSSPIHLISGWPVAGSGSRV